MMSDNGKICSVHETSYQEKGQYIMVVISSHQ